MAVPYLDLKQQHAALASEILADVKSILESAWFVNGKFIAELEKQFAAKSNSTSAVAVASGTAACKLCYQALGLKPGDEIITTPNTFFATCEAAWALGATTRFVDVDPDSFNMDPKALEDAIGPRTKIIVPVHLYGLPCDMDAIMDIAARNGLAVVEDACQSHFATFNGKPVGSFGSAAAFSFYPSKNLGACGDAGICTTSDPGVDRMLRVLRDHGQTGKYTHEAFGDNGRMDEIQAAVLVRKMAHIDNWTRARQAAAARYIEQLSGIPGLRFQHVSEEKTHVYYMFVIRHPEREKIADQFDADRIGYAFRGVRPLHTQKVFAGSPGIEPLPVVELLMQEMLALPIFPEMTMEQVDEVCASVRKALA